MKNFGIESTCDDTSMSILCTESRKILKERSYSQIRHHFPVYGGIVPALAQKLHMEKLESLFKSFSNDFENEIDLIAVANRPGLPYSLKSGLEFAAGLCNKYK